VKLWRRIRRRLRQEQILDPSTPYTVRHPEGATISNRIEGPEFSIAILV
jgi:hypothetical protein